jgi:hypothetical protein
MSVSGNVLVFRTALAAAGLHSQHASAVLRLLLVLACTPTKSHGFVEDSRQLIPHSASPDSSCQSFSNYLISFSSDPRQSEYVLSHAAKPGRCRFLLIDLTH